MKLRSKTLAVLLGGVLLAGCDGSSDTAAPEGISTFGSAFVSMFQADENATPVDAQSVNLTLTPTAEPFNP